MKNSQFHICTMDYLLSGEFMNFKTCTCKKVLMHKKEWEFGSHFLVGKFSIIKLPSTFLDGKLGL